jgi:hypothetical protein
VHMWKWEEFILNLPVVRFSYHYGLSDTPNLILPSGPDKL